MSEYETAKTIIYPGKDGDMYDEMFDSTCLVYQNTKTNVTKMKCTGINFDEQKEDPREGSETSSENYGRY